MPSPFADRHVAAPASPRTKTILQSPLRGPSSVPLLHCSPLQLTPEQAYTATQERNRTKQTPSMLRATRTVPVERIVDDFYTQQLAWMPCGLVVVGSEDQLELRRDADLRVARHIRVPRMHITSVAAHPDAPLIAVGSLDGSIAVVDVETGAAVACAKSHTMRVGALAWTSDGLLFSGSKDRCIAGLDMRARPSPNSRPPSWFGAHDHEVCGLAAQPRAGPLLASGGNDNMLHVWDVRAVSRTPQHAMAEHCAAVRALAWSPARPDVLVSGGGTADKSLRVWDLAGAEPTRSTLSVQTDSQVCALAWSARASAVVSAHGFNEHRCVVWRPADMAPQAVLAGHSERVLYMALSPDGRHVATASPDGTLRQWSLVAPCARRLEF